MRKYNHFEITLELQPTEKRVFGQDQMFKAEFRKIKKIVRMFSKTLAQTRLVSSNHTAKYFLLFSPNTSNTEHLIKSKIIMYIFYAQEKHAD